MVIVVLGALGGEGGVGERLLYVYPSFEFQMQ